MRVFVCEVRRRSPLWVGQVQGTGVFVQGRSLPDVEHSARAALQLAFDGGVFEVRVVARSRELDALVEAQDRYEEALVEATRYLRASRVSWGDVRRVTGVPQGRAKAVMEDRAAAVSEPVDGPAAEPV